MADLAAPRFYDRRAEEKFPTTNNPVVRELCRRIVAWCELERGERILDVGCYDGFLLERLTEVTRAFGAGVDVSHSACVRAAGAMTTLDASIVCAPATRLPFAPNSFDVAICSELLEHLDDVDSGVSEISRVLKPGGRLYATIPNSLEDVFRPLRSTCRLVDSVEGHIHRMDAANLIETLRRHHLEIVRFRYRGFVASAIWYRTVIYSPRINARGHSLVSSDDRRSRGLRSLVYLAMRAYLGIDRLFSRYSGCMGIDVVARRVEDL